MKFILKKQKMNNTLKIKSLKKLSVPKNQNIEPEENVFCSTLSNQLITIIDIEKFLLSRESINTSFIVFYGCIICEFNIKKLLYILYYSFDPIKREDEELLKKYIFKIHCDINVEKYKTYFTDKLEMYRSDFDYYLETFESLYNSKDYEGKCSVSAFRYNFQNNLSGNQLIFEKNQELKKEIKEIIEGLINEKQIY